MESVPSCFDQLERHCKQRLLLQSDDTVKPYCKHKNSIETKLKLIVECFETYRGTLRKHQSNAILKEREKTKCSSMRLVQHLLGSSLLDHSCQTAP